jgi:hypothetical protein
LRAAPSSSTFDPKNMELAPSSDPDRLERLQYFLPSVRVVDKDLSDGTTSYEIMNFATPDLGYTPDGYPQFR